MMVAFMRLLHSSMVVKGRNQEKRQGLVVAAVAVVVEVVVVIIILERGLVVVVVEICRIRGDSFCLGRESTCNVLFKAFKVWL
jgi:hypothetical protein